MFLHLYIYNAVAALLLVLIFLIFFVHYALYRSLETQQSVVIESLYSQTLPSSDELHAASYNNIDNHDSGYLGMAVQLYVQAHLGHYHILTQKAKN